MFLYKAIFNMKNSSIFLALIIALTAVSCEKDPVPPGIIVTPNTYIEYVDLEDLIAVSYTHLTLPTSDLV